MGETTKEKKLGNLFDLVCDDLTVRIQSGDATSADLNIARQMLKDNGITATPVKESPLAKLTNALPFPTSGGVSEAKASL